jgi:hypothetical protein
MFATAPIRTLGLVSPEVKTGIATIMPRTKTSPANTWAARFDLAMVAHV